MDLEECRRAAENGDPEAQYRYGRAVYKKDQAEASRWFRKSAGRRFLAAVCSLADCYYHGNGVEQDLEEALRLYKMAAEETHGSVLIYKEEVDADYVETVRRDAMRGDRYWQYFLGMCYYLGGDGVPQDYPEAVKWFRKAAEQGEGKARIQLGDCYHCGYGVPIDLHEAAKWYKLAINTEE